ncbi:MAG: uracil-DNA glycosylase [Candidatus Kapabacteria bacterium]|nr:uracil-DNA glycosylase [Candidatus Kapabacteria bacterium]
MNLYKKIESYLKFQFSDNQLIYLDKKKGIESKIKIIENQDAKITSEVETIIGELNNQILLSSNDLFTTEPDWVRSNNLDDLYHNIKDCQKCPLGLTRKNFVFGSGNPKADIMFIGEAPGADEDEQGLPFVGKAGQLLTKIIESINLKRDEVYICNILKCRPPNNRRPLISETDECEPYLHKQIELIKPKFIIALGLTSAETLLKKKVKMAEIEGKLIEYLGTKMLVTYHPAALLRNPEWKRNVWEVMKKLRSLYDDYLKNISNS